ncbi:hypothetical protein Taro_017485 [Colocasia esculenta]|uniref:ARMC9 CTLH-like domain-containing protein n=1 Tax=Colocasia esculenta TaxID=4460 RepID=A0A843UTB7_COLES|nr:hypothetical protein [Colocasia esculenta]
METPSAKTASVIKKPRKRRTPRAVPNRIIITSHRRRAEPLVLVPSRAAKARGRDWRGWRAMDNMVYAEELVREFLVFRGFTATLQTFEAELATDIGKGFQVEKLLDLVFCTYVPSFQADKLVGLLRFFRHRLSSSSDAALAAALGKLEVSILRYYVVHAIQSGRQDKVIEFFGAHGADLMRRREDWTPWFGGDLHLFVLVISIPYIKNPNLDPQFRVYFSKEWLDALRLSFRNFLSEIFNDGSYCDDVFEMLSVPHSARCCSSDGRSFCPTIGLDRHRNLSPVVSNTRIPALLKIGTEKNTVKHLQNDIKQLNTRLSQLQALLEAKEAELCQMRSVGSSVNETSRLLENSFNHSCMKGILQDDLVCNSVSEDHHHVSDHVSVESASNLEEMVVGKGASDAPSSDSVVSELRLPEPGLNSESESRLRHRVDKGMDATLMFQAGSEVNSVKEEEFPEVKVEFQASLCDILCLFETFLGHTSPITRCRFSATGTNIASASADGTVRIWTYNSSTPTSRNATIYCGAEIMSLDWECRSDRLLLIGTADGGIKAWNVDAKRVVCDLSTTSDYPSVLDLKCSPVEPIFVSAAASRRHAASPLDQMGFASLTVWNMKTWKAMSVLPLGKDPPAITSLCFNHNGKILAASATDGMIHMFDMSANLQITGWPAHDSAVNSVLFGPDETSIFSLGSDGKASALAFFRLKKHSFVIFEWSLQNQGQVLWSRDCSRFCNLGSSKRLKHEISLDSNGRRLLVTSNSVRSPVYQVQGHMSGFRTLPHTSAVTTVDWHPTLPIFLTGSVDHSVRVTSIA